MDQEATEFSVVCVSPEGAHFRVRVAAGSAEAAVGEAIARGHDARIAFRSDLPEAEKRRALEALRVPGASCPICGYSLAGLPEGVAGQVTCPECGSWRGAAGTYPGPGNLGVVLTRRGVELLLGVSVFLSILEALRVMQSRGVPALALVALAVALMVQFISGRQRGGPVIVLAAGVAVVGVIRLIWT